MAPDGFGGIGQRGPFEVLPGRRCPLDSFPLVGFFRTLLSPGFAPPEEQAFCDSTRPSCSVGGRYLDANDAFSQMLGRPLDEIRGRTAAELGFWVDPTNRDEMVGQLREPGRVIAFPRS